MVAQGKIFGYAKFCLATLKTLPLRSIRVWRKKNGKSDYLNLWSQLRWLHVMKHALAQSPVGHLQRAFLISNAQFIFLNFYRRTSLQITYSFGNYDRCLSQNYRHWSTCIKFRCPMINAISLTISSLKITHSRLVDLFKHPAAPKCTRKSHDQPSFALKRINTLKTPLCRYTYVV